MMIIMLHQVQCLAARSRRAEGGWLNCSPSTQSAACTELSRSSIHSPWPWWQPVNPISSGCSPRTRLSGVPDVPIAMFDRWKAENYGLPPAGPRPPGHLPTSTWVRQRRRGADKRPRRPAVQLTTQLSGPAAPRHRCRWTGTSRCSR